MSESISVIVTCYNLERYIGEAIESVLAQDVGAHVELIVVDDASTDDSRDVIARFPQVRLLQSASNGGVLQATVLGLRAASHDIVAFLDGDDRWHPGKLKKALAAFTANPALGLITHDLRYVDGDGNALPRRTRPAHVMPEIATAAEYDALIRNGILEQGDYVWLGSALAIRRSVVDAEGFCQFTERLPDARNTYQDWPLAVWCAAQWQVTMGYIPEVLFDYRLHLANHSGDARTVEKARRNVTRTLNTLRAIEGIALRHGPLSQRATHAIRSKRMYYEYMLALYSNQRWAALRGFMRTQGYVLRGDTNAWKEYARFVSVQLLGIDGFIKRLNRP